MSQASIGGVENCWSSTCASLRTCRGGKAALSQSNRASASCTFVARSIREDSRSQSSAPISTALLWSSMVQALPQSMTPVSSANRSEMSTRVRWRLEARSAATRVPMA